MTDHLVTRRQFARAAAAPAFAALPASQPRDLRPLRMLLNSGYSSVNAWFCLADDRGYFREEGLRLSFTAGRGAYTAAGRTAAEGFDVGYGDINALVEEVAASNPRAPIAVYVLFNQSPSVIAVPADSPIRTPADFPGRHFRGHATDVALQTFPALAAVHGIDAARVRISSSEDGMGAVVETMLRGETDGTFGYESTITAALVTAGLPPSRIRFFFYRTLVPDLYGSALMVSRRLAAESPEVVRGLVRAVNRGVRDVVTDPTAALTALKRRLPSAHDGAERARLELTMRGDMAHPDGGRLGLGAIDPVRFGAGVQLLCRAKRLARTPTVSEIVSTSFPIPADQRITTLARPRA